MPEQHTTSPSSSLQQLIAEDAVGQLRRGEGLMMQLGSEDGTPKLDWVEGIARLLNDNVRLEKVEREARDIYRRGVRHILWADVVSPCFTIVAKVVERDGVGLCVVLFFLYTIIKNYDILLLITLSINRP